MFLELAKNINGKIYSIDEHYEGKNNIWFSLEDNGVVRMIVSRDIWRGKQHPTDFIDINIGDNYAYSEIIFCWAARTFTIAR